MPIFYFWVHVMDSFYISDDVMSHIFSYLSTRDALRSAIFVCKHWRDSFFSHTNTFDINVDQLDSYFKAEILDMKSMKERGNRITKFSPDMDIGEILEGWATKRSIIQKIVSTALLCHRLIVCKITNSPNIVFPVFLTDDDLGQILEKQVSGEIYIYIYIHTL